MTCTLFIQDNIRVSTWTLTVVLKNKWHINKYFLDNQKRFVQTNAIFQTDKKRAMYKLVFHPGVSNLWVMSTLIPVAKACNHPWFSLVHDTPGTRKKHEGIEKEVPQVNASRQVY